MKTRTIIGIGLIVIGIIFFYAALVSHFLYNKPIIKENIKCYDSNHNEIIGLTCKEVGREVTHLEAMLFILWFLCCTLGIILL